MPTVTLRWPISTSGCSMCLVPQMFVGADRAIQLSTAERVPDRMFIDPGACGTSARWIHGLSRSNRWTGPSPRCSARAADETMVLMRCAYFAATSLSDMYRACEPARTEAECSLVRIARGVRCQRRSWYANEEVAAGGLRSCGDPLDVKIGYKRSDPAGVDAEDLALTRSRRHPRPSFRSTNPAAQVRSSRIGLGTVQ